ncbi:hypothetical protein RQP46_003880 [Phenoliferia psychrophenolica]
MRPTKKQHLTQPVEARQTPAPKLPLDVLQCIFTCLSDELGDSDEGTLELLAVGGVAKDWRTASRTIAYRSISLLTASRVILFARTLKQTPDLALSIRSLDLRISNVWSELGNKSASNWKGHSVAQVLRASVKLSSLALALGPSPSSSGHIAYIAKDIPATFNSFNHLQSFTLSTSIWLADLAPLLACWPSLETLALADVRGDCGHHLTSLCPTSLKHLTIDSNTLSPQHIRWFLDRTTQLTHLALGLPGHDSTVFEALLPLAPILTSLRLTNRFVCVKTPHPPRPSASPLLPVLALAASLEELELSTDLVGADEGIDDLLRAVHGIGSVRKLWIEDGLREAIERALKRGELGALEEVVGVGKKAVKSAATGKSFEAVLDKKGIEWSREQ